MNTDGRKVTVKSMVNYSVGLNIPDLRFKRDFTKEGENLLILIPFLKESLLWV